MRVVPLSLEFVGLVASGGKFEVSLPRHSVCVFLSKDLYTIQSHLIGSLSAFELLLQFASHLLSVFYINFVPVFISSFPVCFGKCIPWFRVTLGNKVASRHQVFGWAFSGLGWRFMTGQFGIRQ